MLFGKYFLKCLFMIFCFYPVLVCPIRNIFLVFLFCMWFDSLILSGNASNQKQFRLEVMLGNKKNIFSKNQYTILMIRSNSRFTS